jgi:hypothetical protein
LPPNKPEPKKQVKIKNKMAEKIDQLARMTPKERKILEGITKKNCLEGCQYGKFTSEHNKITEPIDEYLAGHKNNKPRGTRVYSN